MVINSFRWLVIPLSVLLLSAGFVQAGNVIVRNGQLNVSGGFYSDSSTFYVDSSNNRVGIGTASPDKKLTVMSTYTATGESMAGFFNNISTDGFHNNILVGRSASTDNSATFGFIYDTTPGDEVGYISIWGDNPTAGTGLFVRKGGNVGIGTISPKWGLDILGNGNVHFGINPVQNHYTDVMHNTYWNDSVGAWASYGGGPGSLIQPGGGTSSDSYIAFMTSPNSTSVAADSIITLTEKMRIDKDGKVGIGTSSPDSLLTLYGDSPVLNLQNIDGNGGTGGVLRFGHYQDGSTLPVAEIRSYLTNGAGAGNRAGDLVFFTSTEGSLAERMRIAYDGKVGIGTNSSGYLLDVAGRMRVRSDSNSAGVWLSNSTGTNKAFIGLNNDENIGFWGDGGGNWGLIMNRSSGYVGIGTTSPGSKLHIQEGHLLLNHSTTTPYFQISSDTTSSVGALEFRDLGSTERWVVLSRATNRSTEADQFQIIEQYHGGSFYTPVRIYPQTSDNTLVLKDGNVGIGTATPGANLQIGTTKALNIHLSMGGSINPRYYFLGTVSDNNGEFLINGILAGHTPTQGKAIVNVKFSVRDGFLALGNVWGTIGTSSNILVYDDASNNQYLIYLMVDDWAIVNLDISSASGGAVYYNGTYTETDPAGSYSLQYNLSSDAGQTIRSTNSGNFGIGTTNPGTAKLSIGTPESDITSDVKFDITGSGNQTIHVNSNNSDTASRVIVSEGITYGGGIKYAADSNRFYIFTRNGAGDIDTVTMHRNGSNFLIKSGTQVGIGTASPNDALDVVGDIDATGCVQTDDSGSIGGTCISDARFKTNIQSLDGSLDRIAQLNPVTFEWDPQYYGISSENGTGVGLIAQELEQVYPELVVTDANGYKRVRYDIELEMHLIQAVKELKAGNDILATENREQQQQIAALKALVCADHPDSEFCSVSVGEVVGS